MYFQLCFKNVMWSDTYSAFCVNTHSKHTVTQPWVVTEEAGCGVELSSQSSLMLLAYDIDNEVAVH